MRQFLVVFSPIWVMFYHFIKCNLRISFGFDHFDDSLYWCFAEWTNRVGFQLLIAVFADCIMSTGFENDGSDVDIAESAIAIISFVFTSLFLLIIFFRLFLYSPFSYLLYHFSCHFYSCNCQQKNQKKCDETDSIVLFSQFRQRIAHLFGDVTWK